MGYQNVALPSYNQYALLTPTFKAVGGKTSIDLTEIAVVKENASSFTSKKKVKIQKLDAETGSLTGIYQYTTAGNKWTNQSGGDAAVGEVVFEAGDAMFVANTDAANTGLSFQFSGEVALDPVSMNVLPDQYALIGNFTPVSVDLKAIAPKGANGSDLGTSKKKVKIQKLDAETGSLTEIYQYTTAGNKWTNQAGADVAVGDVVFTPGDAMFVANTDTKTISITFPSPLK